MTLSIFWIGLIFATATLLIYLFTPLFKWLLKRKVKFHRR